MLRLMHRATHVDPSLWNHWGGFFFFSDIANKTEAELSRIFLQTLQWVLLTEDDVNGERRLVPAARVYRREVGLIVHAGGRRLVVSSPRINAARRPLLGAASVPLSDKSCSPSRNFARTDLTDGVSRIPAGQQTALLSSLQHAPPPRTRLGPAVIGRAGSPANHSPHVRVTA